MSYWVYLLNDAGESVPVESFLAGGTYALGGSTCAELNVTYNYSGIFATHEWHPRRLHERRADDTIPELRDLAERLPNAPASDYWAATPGNAGAVVHQLLRWAEQHPHAVWRVS